jgi:hypothetical protein
MFSQIKNIVSGTITAEEVIDAVLAIK